jgi:uncharacterized protein (UPF0262 family)
MRRPVAAALLLLFSLLSAPADARPLYFRAYKEEFPEQAHRYALKCDICHRGDSKRLHNEYGQKFKDKLDGRKNLTDLDEIRRILRELGPLPVRETD